MLENHYMLFVGLFQVSLLFSRTSELQEVGNALLRTRNFKLFSVWWETAVPSPLSLGGQLKNFGMLKFKSGLSFLIFLQYALYSFFFFNKIFLTAKKTMDMFRLNLGLVF